MYIRPNSNYPFNWNRRRYAIFKKYGYICQLCGRYSKGDLALHHITPKGCGGLDTDDNMIPVCNECHTYIHSGNYSGPLLKLRRMI